MLLGSILVATEYAKLVEFNATFIIQIFNTIILFAALSYLLFKPVKKTMDDRKNKIIKQFEDAELKMKEAEDLKIEYQNKIAAIRVEREHIINEAVSIANKQSAEIKADTIRDIEIMKENAALEIKADRQKMLDGVKDEVASIALLIASKVLSKELQTSEKDIIIDDFIDKVGDVKWDK